MFFCQPKCQIFCIHFSQESSAVKGHLLPSGITQSHNTVLYIHVGTEQCTVYNTRQNGRQLHSTLEMPRKEKQRVYNKLQRHGNGSYVQYLQNNMFYSQCTKNICFANLTLNMCPFNWPTQQGRKSQKYQLPICRCIKKFPDCTYRPECINLI
jgi:hypothetical protein